MKRGNEDELRVEELERNYKKRKIRTRIKGGVKEEVNTNMNEEEEEDKGAIRVVTHRRFHR